MRLSVWVVGGAVIVGTVFFGTLYVLDKISSPQAPSSQTSSAQSQNEVWSDVVDQATAVAAAQKAGYQSSPGVHALIDGLQRNADGSVDIYGWVADLSARTKPMTMLLFQNGKEIAKIKSSGDRADIGPSLGLGPEDLHNILIRAKISCNAGQPLTAVVITESKKYVVTPAPKCP